MSEEPRYRELPAGWRDAGGSGAREECLAYVRQVWQDLRPKRLRGQDHA